MRPTPLDNQDGARVHETIVREQWQEAAKAAGSVDLHVPDLRGTGETMLAEVDCTVPEIASVTGPQPKARAGDRGQTRRRAHRHLSRHRCSRFSLRRVSGELPRPSNRLAQGADLNALARAEQLFPTNIFAPYNERTSNHPPRMVVSAKSAS